MTFRSRSASARNVKLLSFTDEEEEEGMAMGQEVKPVVIQSSARNKKRKMGITSSTSSSSSSSSFAASSLFPEGAADLVEKKSSLSSRPAYLQSQGEYTKEKMEMLKKSSVLVFGSAEEDQELLDAAAAGDDHDTTMHKPPSNGGGFVANLDDLQQLGVIDDDFKNGDQLSLDKVQAMRKRNDEEEERLKQKAREAKEKREWMRRNNADNSDSKKRPDETNDHLFIPLDDDLDDSEFVPFHLRRTLRDPQGSNNRQKRNHDEDDDDGTGDRRGGRSRNRRNRLMADEDGPDSSGDEKDDASGLVREDEDDDELPEYEDQQGYKISFGDPGKDNKQQSASTREQLKEALDDFQQTKEYDPVDKLMNEDILMEDEENIMWEQQQIKKALNQKRPSSSSSTSPFSTDRPFSFASASSASSSSSLMFPIKKYPAPKSLESIQAQVNRAAEKLRTAHNETTQQQRKIQSLIDDSKEQTQKLEKESSSTSEELSFHREVSRFLQNYIACMEEKGPEIIVLCDSLFDNLKKSVSQIHQMAHRDRVAVSHLDVSGALQNEINSFEHLWKTLMSDVEDDFCNLEKLVRLLDQWKAKYPQTYHQTYCADSLPQLVTPLLETELSCWDCLKNPTILSETKKKMIDLTSSENGSNEMLVGFSALYEHLSGQTTLVDVSQRTDLEPLATIIDELVIPRILKAVQIEFVPYDNNHAFSVTSLCQQLCRLFPGTLSKPLNV